MATAVRTSVGDRAAPVDEHEHADHHLRQLESVRGDHHNASPVIQQEQGSVSGIADFPPLDAAINELIAQLQDGASDWKRGPIDLSHWSRTIREWVLELWPAFIPADWQGRLIGRPELLLTFCRERSCVLGHYRPGRNDAGLRYEVSVNPRHLILRPEADVAATVLHELLHCFEDLVGTARVHRNNYHSAWFRRTAAAIGIPCSRYGADLGIREASPFAEWIQHRGLQSVSRPGAAVEATAQVAAERNHERRRVWTCHCPTSDRILLLVAKGAELLARCERCGERFGRRPERG